MFMVHDMNILVWEYGWADLCSEHGIVLLLSPFVCPSFILFRFPESLRDGMICLLVCELHLFTIFVLFVDGRICIAWHSMYVRARVCTFIY